MVIVNANSYSHLPCASHPEPSCTPLYRYLQYGCVARLLRTSINCTVMTLYLYLYMLAISLLLPSLIPNLLSLTLQKSEPSHTQLHTKYLIMPLHKHVHHFFRDLLIPDVKKIDPYDLHFTGLHLNRGFKSREPRIDPNWTPIQPYDFGPYQEICEERRQAGLIHTLPRPMRNGPRPDGRP